ncbi:MAG: transposase [Ignavibacteriaceae bacterium]
MQKYYIKERKHRLPKGLYIGEIAVSFTACIKDRKCLFTNENIFNEFEKILLDELKSTSCSSYVYLFMPDHLHTIIKGNMPEVNLKTCMDKFKQKTGYWLSKNIIDKKWQKDYYDHIIREEENLEIQVQYILNNPVRAGLVEHWKDYPYKGSTIFKLNEWE